MKGNNSKLQYTILYSLLALAVVQTATAQTPERIWTTPRFGTFWSMQMTNQPPLPFLPDFLPTDTPLYRVGTNGTYVYDDRSVDYPALREFTATLDSLTGPPAPGEGGYGSGDTNAYPPTPTYGPNDLYLELERSATPGLGDLYLHHTQTGKWYQWLSTPDIAIPLAAWTPGSIIDGDGTVERVHFTPSITISNGMRFYRAVGGDTIVSLTKGPYSPTTVQEPCPDTNTFTFHISVTPPVSRPLTVDYGIAGTASNGVDYAHLSGSVALPAYSSGTDIDIIPYSDSLFEFEETVTISLRPANGYLADPQHSSYTFFIEDCATNVFTVVATNVPEAIGIGYHEPTKSLIVSQNYSTGLPANFARLDTNGVATQWSSISGVLDEVKLAIAPATTNGWTNGDMYFGSDTFIGHVSADGTTVNTSWVTLTNGAVTNALRLRGSLCFDRTGVWSNDLIAVTSDVSPDYIYMQPKGVWRINSSGQTFLIANIPTPHLEGVACIPNDTNKWGPLAGAIITGDESALDYDFDPPVPDPTVFVIHPSGHVESYHLEIFPEDFDIFTNDDLYCVNHSDIGENRILKVSKTLLTPNVGDLLVTQAGEEYDGFNPKLCILRWDGTTLKAERTIPLPKDTFSGDLEHVTFAPITIPNIQ